MKAKLFQPVPILLAALVLTGCSLLGHKLPVEQQVEKRVSEQMNAFINEEYEKAYSYMSPGYREKKTFVEFGNDFAGMVDLVDFEVVSVECAEERCEVSLKRTQNMPDFIAETTSGEPFPFVVVTKQIWVSNKGQWYHYKR